MADNDSNIFYKNITAKDTHASPAAAQAAINTYELLECIIKALPPQDILIAANVVSKTWHHIIATSTAINKQIISSSFLAHQLKDGGYLRIRDITYLNIYWADVVIKRVKHNEIIYVMDKLYHETFQARFLKGDEDIAGLTEGDSARLRKGWTQAFRLCDHRGFDGDELFTRFELGSHKHIDPLRGNQAQQAYEMCKETRSWRKSRGSRIGISFYLTWDWLFDVELERQG